MPLKLELTAIEDAAITNAALEDPDCPPLTDAELAAMRPAVEVVPEIVKQYCRFKMVFLNRNSGDMQHLTTDSC